MDSVLSVGYLDSVLAVDFSVMEQEQEEQGGRCYASVRAALTERSGSSSKGRTPNIRYFVAKQIFTQL